MTEEMRMQLCLGRFMAWTYPSQIVHLCQSANTAAVPGADGRIKKQRGVLRYIFSTNPVNLYRDYENMT